MEQTTKRRRVERAAPKPRPEPRVERNADFLRRFKPNFTANDLEILDELFSDATLPPGIRKNITERWRIRLEDLLYKAGDDIGLAQRLVAKVVEDRTGSRTHELIPDDLYNVHDQFSICEGERKLASTFKETSELKTFIANLQRMIASEAADADEAGRGSNEPDLTQGMDSQQLTGSGQPADEIFKEPQGGSRFNFATGRFDASWDSPSYRQSSPAHRKSSPHFNPQARYKPVTPPAKPRDPTHLPRTPYSDDGDDSESDWDDSEHDGHESESDGDDLESNGDESESDGD